MAELAMHPWSLAGHAIHKRTRRRRVVVHTFLRRTLMALDHDARRPPSYLSYELMNCL